MADNPTNTFVTPFMKELTTEKYNAILSDVNTLLEMGAVGLKELKRIIDADPSVEFKAKFNNKNDKKNGYFYYFDALEGGLDGANYGLKPKGASTESKVKEIYNKYFKAIENAGTGTQYTYNGKTYSPPEYGVRSNQNAILVFDSGAFASADVLFTLYKSSVLQDTYATKAVADYMFRNLFGQEKFTDQAAKTYIMSSSFGITNALISLSRDTVAGILGRLRGIKDKLTNYTVGQEDFNSDPEADSSENANTSQLESEFSSMLAEAGIGFDLAEYVRRKIPSYIYANEGSLDSVKNAFYRSFVKSGEVDIASKDKYFKNIWNRIKTSGLIDLAVSASAIGDFARKRFSVGNNLTDPELGSAGQALDPIRDTIWLNDLVIVTQNLTRDPLTLAIVQSYFPNLATLFFNASAAAADYSGGSEDDPINNIDELAKSLLRAFGTDKDGKPIFKPAWELINTGQRIKKALQDFPFRENIPPKTPDIFHFRLGAANFYVPPISINVSSQFKTGSLTSGAIRQKNSPKFNAGYKETTISVKLFFPNYEEIWGLSIDGIKDLTLNKDFKIDFKEAGNEEKIDKFLSSLRGLVAAFKYAPILPVKNHYLNSVHGISGVALSSMSISTIPNYPFALVVDLELLNFNHKPFLPMIKDFNQAVHWGKFRHYMGKAAGSLHSYINESFLLPKPEDAEEPNPMLTRVTSQTPYYTNPGAVKVNNNVGNQQSEVEPDLVTDPYKNDIFTTNVIKEYRNGNNISLFIPERIQTKLFTPDTSSFRSDEEKMLDDTGQSMWDKLLKTMGIDINQSAGYYRSLGSVVQTSIEGSVSPSARRIVLESIELITAGVRKDTYIEKVYDYFAKAFVVENKSLLTQQEIDYIRKNPNENAGQDYVSKVQVYKYRGKNLVIDNSASQGDERNYSLKDVRDLFKQASRNTSSLLDQLANEEADRKAATTGKSSADFIDQAKEDIGRAFNVLVYNRFFKSGPIKDLMEARRLRQANYQFNEWEVPMFKVDLDPKAVIVNGVSVTLGNNLAKLQLQMQEEPTYQHIGGKDSYINISMTVFGEKELIKLRKVFEHINGLARIEHSTGVIGFMGIKNIVASLAGIKYVMPLSYEVNTIPNFPHVYDVRMSLVDFDIFQQQRETISSKQQKEMIETFGTKRNPFLRIKQLWGAFNAYPDFPLSVKDQNGEVVGNLDPDYYFRSFEMFDDDVIEHLAPEQEKLKSFSITPKQLNTQSTSDHEKNVNRILGEIKVMVQNNQLKKLKEYFDKEQIGLLEASAYIEGAVREFFKGQKKNLLIDFIKEYPDVDDKTATFGLTAGLGSSNIKLNTSVGDLSYSDSSATQQIQNILETKDLVVSEDGYLSIDPDELTIHHTITYIPAEENPSDDKMPAFLYHANGYHLGYVSKSNNRFYFTVDGVRPVKSESGNSNDGKLSYVPISVPFSDADDPSKTYKKGEGSAHIDSLKGAGSNLADFSDPYSASSGDNPEVMSTQAANSNVAKHWERMLIDTKYRDISGRMIRAFPTYMLWLIDEGGYFSGVKLFDNFYGLQSIIDFSVVQSEDILGDTLILRVSNLYSKLTTAESSRIFDTEEEFQNEQLTQLDGIESVLDKALNRARNMVSHMENTYVVDINSIRLKPGVRVHLRVGYGSNPNSLQTLFNGVITSVENGEIVTITAQSDAIELSPIVNSTNKKGDSGKIDGGINTGFWLSEPRDLMVRLLTMGSSRTREAIAHATRGRIFSENKFGIRHFGQILYEPLNDLEAAKNEAVVSQVKNMFDSLGEASGNAWGIGSAMGILASGSNEGGGSLFGIGPEIRAPGVALMRTLWANFSAQRDFEIFKRNIYPGNGTGIAQFLGGDLGDGWSTIASITPEDKPNERLEYIGRLTDYSWNEMTAKAGNGIFDGNADAKQLIDINGKPNEIGNSNSSAGFAKVALSGAVAAAGIAVTGGLGAPIIGGVLAAGGLSGVLSGRGGTNLFNAMGITSGMDDDLPGLDEVSFRAQTYMRTVWDLFQMCARLLPNYIVAIRPFEDRSTVFYGKPHWLYTSGVVPLTTGYPGTKRAQELGISSPKELDVDSVLENAMKAINESSNPLADAAAFTSLDTSMISVQDTLSQQLNAKEGGVYIPADSLKDKNGKGRVIAFGYESTMEYRDSSGNPIAKLPASLGYATVGFHLPISSEDVTEVPLDESQIQGHRQIDQLPLRYRFPFFTDRDDGIVLEDFAYYALSDELGTWNGNTADYMKLVRDNKSYNGVGGNDEETAWISLMKIEKSLYAGITTVAKEEELTNFNGLAIGIKLLSGNIPSFKDKEKEVADKYIFQEKLKTSSVSGVVSVLRMPLPDNPSLLKDPKTNADLYDILKENPNFNTNAAGLRDWKAPKNAQEEQFYIAMKWPYKPSDSFGLESSEQFIQSQGGYTPVGNAKSYQERKVMVYSPTTGKAVVCRPAYYLWGEDTVGGLKPAGDSGIFVDDWSHGYDKFGNPTFVATDKSSKGSGTTGNSLFLETNLALRAIVSPDAAYYLGMLNLTPVEVGLWSSGDHSKEDDWHGGESAITGIAKAGVAPFPVPRKCYYAFVPDDMPLGVVPDFILPIDEYSPPNQEVVYENKAGKKIISFGAYSQKTDILIRATGYSPTGPSDGDNFFEFRVADSITMEDVLNSVGRLEIAGNALGENGEFGPGTKDYFDLVKNKDWEAIENLKDVLKEERKDRSSFAGKRFAPIFDEAEPKSVEARNFYDEDYNRNISVIAGNGRTLQEAIRVWDQFRAKYHTYSNVKEAFQKAFGLPPEGEESEQDIGTYLSGGFGLGNKLTDKKSNTPDAAEASASTDKSSKNLFKNYSESNNSAEDEFSLVFGDRFFAGPEWIGSENAAAQAALRINPEKIRQGLEKARTEFIDNPDSSNGLISYYNELLNNRLDKILGIIRDSLRLSGIAEKEDQDQYIASIRTSKQLFLFMVGAFRNRMWSDPYARAWLVLKPNRKLSYDGRNDEWDFNPVLKIFQAYIDPNEDYAKSKDKFTKLLAQNRSEGSSATSIIGKWGEDVNGFWDKNIGPLFTALGDSLSGLVNLFRMSMMQLGYGLSQVGQMTKQANILNKVLNDSIYYSLGRPGSLLRAVDNPFTREYAEPVIEIRQPFQRVHYLSSFSHILSNGITENLNGIATMITAVSDGKYPVTVAMDKSAPAERQVEKTVETGLFFDNATGSGLFGALHPILHPFEFARGISKFAQGTPDEMLARRVGLAHLKESLKDIYTGEILITGNADIRPHDIVYLADVYERMYGMFEVEQVVHHFTSELGFVTSITPNALVTVNDPAKWFMSSWIGTWMHMQALRNDTRLYMSSIGSGVNAMGQISVDGLADSLQTQMVGGIQYTHGAAALTKDIMAHFTSEGINDINSQVKGLVAQGSAAASGQIALGGMGAMFAGATALGATAAGIASMAIPGAGALIGGAAFGLGAGAGGKLAWKGWTWMRDNVLDQHGCYIQYLNRNGRAMDAGLGLSGQGMVVGRYHTKKLLPGILGVSSKIRTAEGYSYIRTNDLLSKLGWKEKEINDLTRYIDYENALVNTQVLRYSGIGPEKAGLNRFFKVICKVVDTIDGDTIDVIDLLDTSEKKFRIRFDGINTPEINVIKTDLHTSGKVANITNVQVSSGKATITTEAPHTFETDEVCVIVIDNPGGFYLLNSSAKIESTPTANTFVVSTVLPDNNAAKTGKVRVYAKGSGEFVNSSSPGGKAKMFTMNALKDKVFVLRISPENVTGSFTELDFEAGSTKSLERKLIHGESLPAYYDKDVFGERILGVVFYKTPQQALETIIKETNSLFEKYKKASNSDLVSQLASSFSPGVFSDRYSDLLEKTKTINKIDYYTQYKTTPLNGISPGLKKTYNAYVALRLIQYIYEKVSEWPNVEWDEYYDDGTPVSLNYELIINGLAKVYTKGLLIKQPSVIDSYENAALPSRVTIREER